jgi:hypothetical protein
VGGAPVAYTSLRSTYMHEVDSIIGFQMLNDPGAVDSPQTFQQAAQHIGYTFNWFYADSTHIAYYNSGLNPVRPATVAPDLPTWADPRYTWAGFDPATYTADYTPPDQHPQSIDQDYYVSWNNKQADDYSAAGFGDGSVHRANLLDTRVKALVTSGTKVTRASLTQAMESAAVTDLRGEDVLPELLQVIGTAPISDPAQASAVAALRTWLAHGAVRKETSAGSHVYADATAIQDFDAWWPLLVQAEFGPVLGSSLLAQVESDFPINDEPGHGAPVHGTPSTAHQGSAFDVGFYGIVQKDLRAVLRQKVRGPLNRVYCGNGSLSACRTALDSSLAAAVAQSPDQVYPADGVCQAGDQMCHDSIQFRAIGAITQPLTEWINRPTFQQADEIQGHGPG